MSSRAAVMAALARQVENEVRRIAVNCEAELIAATPVDTGFARASWRAGVGSAPTGDGPGGEGAAAALAGYTLDDGSAFLANNVRYIQRLNAGWSDQAPADFVADALARGVASP